MKYVVVFLAVLLTSCGLDSPDEPTLMGVFVDSSAYITSIYQGRKAIVSKVNVGKTEGAQGNKYFKFLQGAKIRIDGKIYRFYLDTADYYTTEFNFWIFDNARQSWDQWTRLDRNEHINDKEALMIDYKGLYKATYPDSMSPKLYGYGQESDLLFFLAVVNDTNMIMDPEYIDLVNDFHKKELGGILIEQPETIRLNDTLWIYDFNTKTLVYGLDTIRSGVFYNMAVRKLARALVSGYGKTTSKELQDKYHQYGTTRERYISEYIVCPGDSVWFTGRISGDSVIAFYQH